MSAKPAQNPKHRLEGLGLAWTLAAVLLLLSFVRMMGDSTSAALQFGVLESAITEPLWRTRLGFNVGLFFLALLLLHACLGLGCWLLARLSEFAVAAARLSRRYWVTVWFLALASWLLIANAAKFPHSSLGAPYHDLVTGRWFGLSIYAVATVLLLAALSGVLITAFMRMQSRSRVRFAAMAATGAAVLLALGLEPRVARSNQTQVDKPHIIFIGVDSLRPDAVRNAGQVLAPNIGDFLAHASEMSDAITPLARTFSSWVSILTGRHPHSTRAYMSLLPRSTIDTGLTLAQQLRDNGYHTAYGIDESRFSNIDESYGFDQTMTPPIGGSDFVLAWLGDTPLSNLLMNSRVGAVLFPHLHANRAAHITYDPDTFVRRIDRALSFDQPTFLAVHLTLPHWPYTWATSAASTHNDRTARGEYGESVARADQQFGDLLHVLRERGVLDNAVVVVLSDHGEALGHDHEFMADIFPHKGDAATKFQKWGHGTSVFSPSQYRVVLGFRAFGKAASRLPAPRRIDAPVSLLDVKPTVLELLGVKSNEPLDGQSLLPLLTNPDAHAAAYAERIRFTESEFNPQGFTFDELTPSAVAAAATTYRVDAVTDRVEVRTELLPFIMANRQYAALLGPNAMAAAIPVAEQAGHFELIYANVPNEARARLQHAIEQRFAIKTTPGETLKP